MENENNVQENVQEKPSFDELLKNPEYQREFDRKLEGARTKWQEKWQEEATKKQEEAERLAKMTENEKHQHELDIANQAKSKAESELNAYKLKDTASKIAKEKGVDSSFLDLFDFTKETAETIANKIDVLKNNLDKNTETRLNEKLNQSAPQNHENNVSNGKPFSRASF